MQSVLILGVALPAPHANVLHGLQEQRSARHLRQLAAQSGDHLVGADLALRQRLERHKDKPAVGLPAAGEPHDVIHRWILLYDRNELRELLAHELERNALIGLNAPGQPASILLRKKALLNDREQVAIETERSQEDQQDRARVAQRPCKAALIDIQRAGENALAQPIEAAMLFTLRPL